MNRSSVAISTEFAELAAGIRGDGTAGDQWGRIGQLAVEHVPGCTWASISNLHAGKGRSLAASDPVAAGLDQLQFELGGPVPAVGLRRRQRPVPESRHGSPVAAVCGAGSNRQIGMAIGVLMAHHKITEDDAFALLRVASQALHRKLPDIAAEVTERGILPELPCRSANTRPVPVDQG